ncbi:MAG: hypothetical protein WBL63_15530 [Candidatus Acidiferrum sp.]
MKKQKAFSFLQLLIEVAITLFIAGIIVPSLFRSEWATNRALAAGSLHTINVAGIAFSYTNQNLGFACLGALAGAITAFAIHFHSAMPKNVVSTRARVLPAVLL